MRRDTRVLLVSTAPTGEAVGKAFKITSEPIRPRLTPRADLQWAANSITLRGEWPRTLMVSYPYVGQAGTLLN